MKVDRIRVGEASPKGRYSSIRLELEARLDDEDDLSNAIEALYNRLVQELRKLKEGEKA